MSKRSITDEEIALIKAMAARGTKNKDIQFFFNRPSRPVNSGRISTILSGKYGDSGKISAASDEQLTEFLASHPPSAEMPRLALVTGGEGVDPLAKTTILKMFAKDSAGVWRLAVGETDYTECKESFGLKHPGAWLRAMAALANNRGGYIFFGVGDKDTDGKEAHRVIGMVGEEFAKTDPAEIAKRVRSTFDPTPRFQTTVVEVGGKKVGVMHIDQHSSRPVVAAKADEKISESDIFFRYPGTSTRIKYGDLRALLDARDAQMRAEILPMVERLLALGPDRAMIADLEDGKSTDGKRTIQIERSLIDRISFIKEGEFEEAAGAPTLRLIGDVEAVGMPSPAAVKKGIVTQPEMLHDFLTGQCAAEPVDYIRLALEIAHSGWLPIRYFADAAGLSHKDLIAFIDASKATTARKKTLRDRLSSSDQAFVLAKGPVAAARDRLLAGEDLAPSDAKDARIAACAIQGLARPLTIDTGQLKSLLAKCLDLAGASEDEATKSAVRKAIARLDELLFG